MEIAFAHRTFAWGSDARGKAHVHVVIIGLTHRDSEPQEKRLFSYDDINGEPDETRHGALTAYLFGAENVANRHLVVSEEGRPVNGAPRLIVGSKPVSGGYFIFPPNDMLNGLERHACLYALFRTLLGLKEFLKLSH